MKPLNGKFKKFEIPSDLSHTQPTPCPAITRIDFDEPKEDGDTIDE